MKNIIIGTAGHVDHGKTCLIKSLTGTDCDRLKEEKKRGITIENGFADFTYKDYNISIIDVPGHEKFIRNMLMGIGGIDLVLLVIALDEGVMPQTIEHFRILSILNINRGIVVYTKKDLVNDETWVNMVKDDVKELTHGTFMENAPSIMVSSFNGEGISELKDLIIENIDDTKLKNDSSNLFRLPIDRVFTIDGFGTVVTGTLLEGRVNVGDEVMLYPDEKVAKVRNIQVHNEKVDTAFAGQRTAINLQNVKKEEINRGALLSNKDSLKPTMMLDCYLEVFNDSKKDLINEQRVHIYTGSSEALGKVIILDRDVIKKGEASFVQIRLEESITVRRNDRFVVRFYSPLLTIGGGEVLDENPKKHKRFDKTAINDLAILKDGEDLDILKLIIQNSIRNHYDINSLALKIRKNIDYTKTLIDKLVKDKEAFYLKSGKLVSSKEILSLNNVGKEILSNYHKENKMSSGLLKEEFKSKLNIDNEILDLVLQNGDIVLRGNAVSLKGFSVEESPEALKAKERILKLYREKPYEMPSIDEVLATEKDKKNALHILGILENEGKLVRLNDIYYIDKTSYDEAVNMILEKIDKDGKIALSEFRDWAGTSRKYAISILESLDERKITKLVGMERVRYGI